MSSQKKLCRYLPMLLSLLVWGADTEAATATVAAGNNHTLLLKSDGSLWAWGNNAQGQLGDGTTTNRTMPVLITTQIGSVLAVGDSNFAIKDDGSLLAWGANMSAQLGDGTTINRTTPVPVGNGYLRVASDGASTFAFKTDGTRWAWGSNTYGQLEDGSRANQLSPVVSNHRYISASSGICHSAALRDDGTLWTWGCNAAYIGGTAGHFMMGQRGNADQITTNRYNILSQPPNTPAQSSLSGVAAVAASGYYTVAVTTDGSVFTTGQSYEGGSNSLKQQPNASGIAQLSLGQQFTLMLGKDQRLSSIGFDDQGQLGTGKIGDNTCYNLYEVFPTIVACRTAPAVVAGQISSMAVGATHGVALTVDGQVLTWGGNGSGQLGNGGTTGSATPITLPSTPASVPTPIGTDSDRIFNFAENLYPQYFPVHATTGTATVGDKTYIYRFYPSKEIYLGTHNGRVIVHDGKQFNMLDVGAVRDFLAQAQTAGF